MRFRHLTSPKISVKIFRLSHKRFFEVPMMWRAMPFSGAVSGWPSSLLAICCFGLEQAGELKSDRFSHQMNVDNWNMDLHRLCKLSFVHVYLHVSKEILDVPTFRWIRPFTPVRSSARAQFFRLGQSAVENQTWKNNLPQTGCKTKPTFSVRFFPVVEPYYWAARWSQSVSGWCQRVAVWERLWNLKTYEKINCLLTIGVEDDSEKTSYNQFWWTACGLKLLAATGHFRAHMRSLPQPEVQLTDFKIGSDSLLHLLLPEEDPMGLVDTGHKTNQLIALFCHWEIWGSRCFWWIPWCQFR